MIDGHTKLVGLIGWPIGHSLSPAMHNAAFDALGLNWRYVPLPVPPGQVEVAVRGLVALGFQGANVTVPHKQAVIPALDVVAPDAGKFGAVNTIIIERSEDGSTIIKGDNTDYKGFVGSLRHAGFDPSGKKAVVNGAGGGGRAVVFGLLQAGAADILVLDVDAERAEALIVSLASEEPSRLRTSPLTTETLIESARTADLLVNATPVGMSPKVNGSIWPQDVPIPPHLTVFDLVYNPLETQFLRQTRESGARAIAGLEMLVRQGALAFDMWTNQAFAVDEIARLMRAACERAIQQ